MEKIIILRSDEDNKNDIVEIYDLNITEKIDYLVVITQKNLISMLNEYGTISKDKPVLYIGKFKLTFTDKRAITTFLERYIGEII